MPDTEHQKWGNATSRQCPVEGEQGTVLPFLNLVTFCLAACSLLAIFPCAFHPYPYSLPSSATSAVWDDRWAEPCQGRRGRQVPVFLQALGRCCLTVGGCPPSWCLSHLS